ncbi:MAG: PLP-dependent aminotransferase family protein [Butyricicoccus sp.]
MRQPLYQNLYLQVRGQIESGHLEAGTRLPSIRQMTRDSSVSRTTVETAYEQLCADGLVTCVPQSGYYVNARPEQRMQELEPEPEQELERVPVRYDFSGHTLDEGSFDFDIWRRLSRAVMAEKELFLRYGDNQGEYALRFQIAKYLSAGRGVYTRPENIVISAGIQSLLSILCEMFDKTKTRIAFEDPGFRKGYRIFADHSYETVFVRGSSTGIDLDELSRSGANMVYLSPSHSFPYGATMPHQKRTALMEWARQQQAIVFEDDYDGELRYTGKPLATLSSLDTDGRVIYLGTFSKLLPPSIRISYAVLPDRLLPLYRRIREQYNQTSSTMEQLTMARFMEEGRLERQVRRLRRIYARKNARMEQAFSDWFGARASVRPNDTGLHVIVSLRGQYDAHRLCDLAEHEGIRLVPMSSYRMGRQTEATTDFYFSSAGISEQDIAPAIEQLSRIWS